MADNKKYYYMRLKENFFDTDDLKFLEAMDDGYLYSNILIKLYLKSLKYEGRLLYKDTIPYNSKMISTITNHSVGVVEKALQIFKDLELITILDGNVLYMSDIELLVGKTSTEADRKREVRKRIDSGEMNGLIKIETNDGQMSDKSTPEIRDKSIELELDIKHKQQAAELESQFEQFWSLYPKKVDKKTAFNKFKLKLKKHDFDTIIKGTASYAKVMQLNNTDKQYIKGAAKFLNNENYLDDQSELLTNKSSKQNKNTLFNPWEVQDGRESNQTNLFDNSGSIPTTVKQIGFGDVL